jgi:CHAT domain-containing protein
MEYQDFEIEITRTSDGVYQVNVIRTPAGEIRQPFTFGLSDGELRERLDQIEDTLRYKKKNLSAKQKRAKLAAMKTFGGALFDALINDNLKSLYDQSRYMAKDQEQGLRLKLRIDDPLLAAVPWELLYDPRLYEFLSTSRQVSIVRYVPLPRVVQLLATKPPLHVLGLVSSPTDLIPLDVAYEKQQVETALKPLVDQGLASLTWLEKANWRALRRAMHRGPWHVLHYIGHSDFDSEADEGYLSLEDEEGKEYRLSANNLGTLLADHGSLRLVLLNSCRGAHIGQDIYSGVAVKLVQRGIPAVIGMQYDISEPAALEFARTFYETLAENRSIETALAEARKAISIALDESAEWGTPVFYTHAPNSLLFAVPQPLPKIGEDPFSSVDTVKRYSIVEIQLSATFSKEEVVSEVLSTIRNQCLENPIVHLKVSENQLNYPWEDLESDSGPLLLEYPFYIHTKTAEPTPPCDEPLRILFTTPEKTAKLEQDVFLGLKEAYGNQVDPVIERDCDRDRLVDRLRERPIHIWHHQGVLLNHGRVNVELTDCSIPLDALLENYAHTKALFLQTQSPIETVVRIPLLLTLPMDFDLADKNILLRGFYGRLLKHPLEVAVFLTHLDLYTEGRNSGWKKFKLRGNIPTTDLFPA